MLCIMEALGVSCRGISFHPRARATARAGNHAPESKPPKAPLQAARYCLRLRLVDAGGREKPAKKVL
jgi:hypothetical protein